MSRILVIDQDQERVQNLGLDGLRRGVAVAIADTVCEGVRVLATRPISLILVDAALLRLTATEQAALFERVAPGVPVAMAVGPETPSHLREGFEQVGFRTVARPAALDDLLADLDLGREAAEVTA